MTFQPRFARVVASLVVLLALFALQPAVEAQRLTRVRVVVNAGNPIQAAGDRVLIAGTSDAPAGSTVTIAVGDERFTTTTDGDGAFSFAWPTGLAAGSYGVRVSITTEDGRTGLASQTLEVTASAVAPGEALPPPVPPRSTDAAAAVPPAAPPPPSGATASAAADASTTYDSRWVLAPQPFGTIPPAVLDYEINTAPSRWNPYRQNKLKGDRPINGKHLFFVLTGIAQTRVDFAKIPVFTGFSSDSQTNEFFGDGNIVAAKQNLAISADLFKGQTNFRPVDWRFRATLIANFNYLGTQENQIVRPDAREGTTRTDSFLALEEWFFEKRIATLSDNFDFISVRVGSQPFNSDFRGFIFNDVNLGLRVFGNAKQNRWQYNAAFFDRLEKDTNSGLNTFESRDSQVIILNVFRQDFVARGNTLTASIHHLTDEASFFFDENGFLARPDATGDFTPHEITATYLGVGTFGRIGRINLDTQLYYVFGEDELNPIAGRELVFDPNTGTFRFESEVDISAYQLSFELSLDKSWIRPRVAMFLTSGDDNVNDRDAKGFDAIFERTNFAGGTFSFWNRQRIPLTGTNVALVNRDSLIPDLSSSKEEGQANFVNPGVLILSFGTDLELTTKWRSILTANYLRFQQTETLEALVTQANIDNEIGFDISAGFVFRPWLNQNLVCQFGAAGLLPGAGFDDIYDNPSTLYQVFADVVFTW